MIQSCEAASIAEKDGDARPFLAYIWRKAGAYPRVGDESPLPPSEA